VNVASRGAAHPFWNDLTVISNPACIRRNDDGRRQPAFLHAFLPDPPARHRLPQIADLLHFYVAAMSAWPPMLANHKPAYSLLPSFGLFPFENHSRGWKVTLKS
jgi:hypothetical protein